MNNIPNYIFDILSLLEKNNFKAYIIGGAVRDFLLKKESKDWDLATNATPEEIQHIFPDSVYENSFGTVGIKIRLKEETKIVEITTFRKDSIYQNNRRPKSVEYVNNLDDDVSRRDFTVNAMAMNHNLEITDLFSGRKDLELKLIRTVGNPQERFTEDALRLLRAIRFATELNFDIETETWKAIQSLAPSLSIISQERIRDEFVKIVMTKDAMKGIQLLESAGLLQYIIPELREGINITQNGHHIYDVWEHLLRTMDYACLNNWSLDIRIAGLLHDIAKPRTKEGEGKYSTFHNHEIVGASMSYEILNRLRFTKKFAGRISKLVRYHMFYYDTEDVTESSVRKLVYNVGTENIKDLIKLRECDRIGSGTPKARPYRLRHFEYMTEKVMTDPISLSMLKINGDILIKNLKFKPGPMIGAILNVLLAEIIENPSLNNINYLSERAIKLEKDNLSHLKKKSLEIIRQTNFEQNLKIKQKYHV